MMNENNNSDIDKKIEDAMREFDMEPSEEVKEKSFQQAMSGIEHSRKKTRSSRKVAPIKRWAGGIALAAVAAAALFIMLLNFGTLDGVLAPTSSDQEDSSKENDEVTPVDDGEEESDSEEREDPNQEDESSDSEVPNYPTVDRDETKTDTTTIEGMEEEKEFKLMNEEELPFTTYIREEFEVESYETDNARGVIIQPSGIDEGTSEEGFGEMEIRFFNPSVGEEEANKAFRAQLLEFNYVDVPNEEDKPLPDWVIETYGYEVSVRKGTATFSQFDGEYFYILSSHTPEGGDGWAAVENEIFEEWEFKKNGEPLEEAGSE